MYKDKLIVLNTIHVSHLIFLITMRKFLQNYLTIAAI